MFRNSVDIQIGDTKKHVQEFRVEGEYVELLGETFYRIRHFDQMAPFFMSLVSSSDHWLFLSSTGGLTAGRIDANSALFPYETDDKITAGSEHTGSRTIFQVHRDGRTWQWEPFSMRYAGLYQCERNLYKNIVGDKVLFEEINHDLHLTFRYAWRTSDTFGFVKSSWLDYHGEDECRIALIDGLQNIMPYGATKLLQNTLSNLLNAYKRNEIEPNSGLGIYVLSATLTDRSEPSESLRASVAWQVGLGPVKHLASSGQLDAFRNGQAVVPEEDVLGRPGAYLVNAELALVSGESRHWHIVADVNQEYGDIVDLLRLLESDSDQLQNRIEADIAQGTDNLVRYVASADGLQVSADQSATAHHFANVVFNIMRGGIFVDGYRVEKRDLLDFVRSRNRPLLSMQAAWFDRLPDEFDVRDLHAWAGESESADLERLAFEYLPLTFSRRHGDPSRPWNAFTITIRQPDGTPYLNYQGNWRDIFQNWEPLALSYPAYAVSMIAKFLNAITADGYNPYRITRDGIEWEVPEPDNPWSNIGYWSDHQIIYLQKLLEIAHQADPVSLSRLWGRSIFASADVPYRLAPYAEMLKDWYNTVEFDWDSERKTEEAVAAIGTDGRLRRDGDGEILHATMAEKFLVLLLAKLTNLVPEGGIWMNTQRPEWNDANNALVGKGLSVVTTAYLRRFIVFWRARLAESAGGLYTIGEDVANLFAEVRTILENNRSRLERGFTNASRREVMDALGAAATAYRTAQYGQEKSRKQSELTQRALDDFLLLALAHVEHTLRVNRRSDALYHAYNVLRLEENGAAVDHLYLMLEGQVAMLSSGLLSAEEALALLRNMRHSELYRADQHAYMLYPNRRLPGFLQKNVVSPDQIRDSKLSTALTAARDRRMISEDADGNYHFHGSLRNAGDLAAVLDTLAQEPAYADLVAAERTFFLALFEKTFNHHAFTGRSGTFFAYEGLGSVYWHMVSKLLLAAQESHAAAVRQNADTATIAGLAAAYYDIRQGLGFNKSSSEYGAFPTDPYSHTPSGAGARQPGMTGQVKEEILTRWGELGVSIQEGALQFTPTLLREAEFLSAPSVFSCQDLSGEKESILLSAGSLAFTFCQTKVVYTTGETEQIEVTYADGRSETVTGSRLGLSTSKHILSRDRQVQLLRVTVKHGRLL